MFLNPLQGSQLKETYIKEKKKKNLQSCKIQQAGNSSRKRSHNRHRIYLTEKHQIPVTPNLQTQISSATTELKNQKPLSYQFQKKKDIFCIFLNQVKIEK